MKVAFSGLLETARIIIPALVRARKKKSRAITIQAKSTVNRSRVVNVIAPIVMTSSGNPMRGLESGPKRR